MCQFLGGGQDRGEQGAFFLDERAVVLHVGRMAGAEGFPAPASPLLGEQDLEVLEVVAGAGEGGERAVQDCFIYSVGGAWRRVSRCSGARRSPSAGWAVRIGRTLIGCRVGASSLTGPIFPASVRPVEPLHAGSEGGRVRLRPVPSPAHRASR